MVHPATANANNKSGFIIILCVLPSLEVYPKSWTNPYTGGASRFLVGRHPHAAANA